MDQAVREGCEVIIGGLNTCRYAQMIHIPNMLIETSKEAFWDALSSAKRSLLIFRKEQEKSMRLQTILDISHDGIIFIDPSRRVTTVNNRVGGISLEKFRPLSRVSKRTFTSNFSRNRT